MTNLTGAQIAEQAPAGWAYLPGAICTRFHTKNFAAGLALTNAIAQAAEEMDHHPDVDLRYARVDVRTWSHDVDAITDRDIRLAHRVTELAASAGLRPQCDDLAVFELGLDSPAHAEVRAFWAAVLAYEVRADVDDEVRDPTRLQPPIWFQASGDEPGRQRWHPDVWVDPAQVAPRIAAALAAGGRLVSDAEAPAFWVLEDAQGNRVCLCTWQSREED
ncbi:MAG: 4a-hydroxytetrahydrobiopterin dehydratase [Sporichthyaceae bacterium]